MITLSSGFSSVGILGTIQGLVSERDTVRENFRKFEPDTVALTISQSMMKGLDEVISGKVKETPVSSLNEIFAAHLGKYGEVQIPPPSMTEAYRLARSASVPCMPVDIGDDEYDDLYLKYISAIQYYRHIGRERKLRTKKFKADNARDFVLEWDFHICRLKGFRKLEEAREKYIAESLLSLMKARTRILAVVELEREKGIVNELRRLLDEE